MLSRPLRAPQKPVNHVLIQLYCTGADYISEHSDKKINAVRGSCIVYLSQGATDCPRAFVTRSFRQTLCMRREKLNCTRALAACSLHTRLRTQMLYHLGRPAPVDFGEWFLRGVAHLYTSSLTDFRGTSPASLPALTHLALTTRAAQPQAAIGEVSVGPFPSPRQMPEPRYPRPRTRPRQPHHPQQPQRRQQKRLIAGPRRTRYHTPSPMVRCPCAILVCTSCPLRCTRASCSQASWVIAAATGTKTKSNSVWGAGRVCARAGVARGPGVRGSYRHAAACSWSLRAMMTLIPRRRMNGIST